MKDSEVNRCNLRCKISESLPKHMFPDVANLRRAVDAVERKINQGKTMKQAIKETTQ